MADHHNFAASPESSNQCDEDYAGQLGHGRDASSSLREQDRLLPIANVSRIMKRALPANAKISKDAKETVQECVSEFISFITGEASDKCQREKRKTVNGDDLLWAMSTLGFEDYIEPLKVYLHKYRELEGERVSMARQGEEGNLGGLPASASGMNDGLNVGEPQISPYGQQLYGQSQLLTSYPRMVPGSGYASDDEVQWRGT